MKKIILTACLMAVFACKKPVEYTPFGEKITAQESVAAADALIHYKAMTVGDTIVTKIEAEVKEVCQAKGCWMKLKLDNEEEVMVKFKDYGFFMPKDIMGEQVIINGKAFVNEMSVKEQRHYAEDAGMSEKEIAEIKLPKKTFSFEADGVLIANYNEEKSN